MKIGDREVTTKLLVAIILSVLAAAGLVWYMLKVIKTPSGAGASVAPGKLSYPRGIAVDSQGALYVADSRNHRIEKYNVADMKVLADFGSYAKVTGGDAKKIVNEAAGKLNEPNGVSVGPDDNVYVIDTWNNRVQIFTSKGKQKKAFTTDDGFFAPREIVVDRNGFAYVADTGKHRIVKFDAEGKKTRAWGAKGDKEGEFNEPIGLALDDSGNLYVADRLNFRIQVFTSDGKFVKEWPVKGWVKDQINMEPHLALDNSRGLLYATDGVAKKIYCWKLSGKQVDTFMTDSSGIPFGIPIGVAVGKDGTLFVADAGSGRIIKMKGHQKEND